MEGLPNTPEINKVTKEEVARELAANPEDVGLLVQFIEQLQVKVEGGEITDLDFNIELAEMYALAVEKNPDPTLKEYAGQSYYDAAFIANQEGNGILRDKLLVESESFS